LKPRTATMTESFSFYSLVICATFLVFFFDVSHAWVNIGGARKIRDSLEKSWTVREVHADVSVPARQRQKFDAAKGRTLVFPSTVWKRSTTTCSSLFASGGFGSAKKKTEAKLKPKQQWDRYLEMKKETRFPVAVKLEKDGADSEWLEVGHVKSKDNAYTKVAVARQRALIADHARRLYPLQVSPKDKIDWGVKEISSSSSDSEDAWVMVDKSILEEGSSTSTALPDALEKLIGFEGTPDPASGYYCYYNEGRLVNAEKDVKAPSTRLE